MQHEAKLILQAKKFENVHLERCFKSRNLTLNASIYELSGKL